MTFKQIFTPAQVLTAIKYHSDVVTASMIAEHMGCKLQTANSLLTTLETDGLVLGVSGGNNPPVVLWSRTAKSIQDVKVCDSNGTNK